MNKILFLILSANSNGYGRLSKIVNFVNFDLPIALHSHRIVGLIMFWKYKWITFYSYCSRKFLAVLQELSKFWIFVKLDLPLTLTNGRIAFILKDIEN